MSVYFHCGQTKEILVDLHERERIMDKHKMRASGDSELAAHVALEFNQSLLISVYDLFPHLRCQ